MSGRAARAAKDRNTELKAFSKDLHGVGFGYGVPWKRLRLGHIKRREIRPIRWLKATGFDVITATGANTEYLVGDHVTLWTAGARKLMAERMYDTSNVHVARSHEAP